MKRLFSYLTVAICLFSSLVFADTQQLKVETGEIKWTGKKVTGQHDGTLTIKSGSLTKDANGIFTATEFVADMTSLKVIDITDADGNAKLLGHLKSDDFFSVEKHTTAEFKSTKVAKVSDKEYTVDGNLTIKGITQPVSFKAAVTPEGDGLTLAADLKIDRTKFEIRYGSGKFFENLGDKMIYDEFELKISAKAK